MILFRHPEVRRALLALAVAVMPAFACALPEDDMQEIESQDAASIEYELDEGTFVQKAHADRPTCIKQGSRLICGNEIRIERAENGNIRKVTATGTPATFEEQPEKDQDIAHFSGATLVFDNEARLVTIDGDAKFWQGNNELSHEHIEYHIDTRKFDATGDDNDASGQMRIKPPASNSD